MDTSTTVAKPKTRSELIGWFMGERAEDPVRLEQFRQALSGLSWEDASAMQSLMKVHDALDALAMAEVRYYFRRRTSRAYLSGVLRTLAWIAGSIGVVLPLLAATGNAQLKELAPFGYVALAVSGSMLAGNALFGGTSGHVRFVSTQLALEQLMTTSRLTWCRLLASFGSTASSDRAAWNNAAFEALDAYGLSMYKLTLDETGHWAETILIELEKFQQTTARPKAGDQPPKGHKPDAALHP